MTTEEFYKASPYFSRHEFDSPDMPGSGDLMDIDFLRRLSFARAMAGIPFKINSGYRTKAHNKKVGGVGDSAHTKGLAADISATNSNQRFIILSALLRSGFDRIGFAKTFIHVDLDTSKVSSLMWTY